MLGHVTGNLDLISTITAQGAALNTLPQQRIRNARCAAIDTTDADAISGVRRSIALRCATNLNTLLILITRHDDEPSLPSTRCLQRRADRAVVQSMPARASDGDCEDTLRLRALPPVFRRREAEARRACRQRPIIHQTKTLHLLRQVNDHPNGALHVDRGFVEAESLRNSATICRPIEHCDNREPTARSLHPHNGRYLVYTFDVSLFFSVDTLRPRFLTCRRHLFHFIGGTVGVIWAQVDNYHRAASPFSAALLKPGVPFLICLGPRKKDAVRPAPGAAGASTSRMA